MTIHTATLPSINPATEKLIASHSTMSPAEIADIIAASTSAFRGWKATPVASRAALLHNAVDVLLNNRHDYAAQITAEMGKPITEAIAEIEKCAFACSYYAEHAATFLADQPMPSDSPHSFVTFAPLGPILAIMPWNFPFWQVFRFAAPTIAAGNTALLKHASNVMGCALMIEEVFRTAQFPNNVFRTLVIDSTQAKSIIADLRICAVTLTGSDSTGSHVASTAGQNLKKTVLELGGSDAFIVLDDANIAKAAEVAARSRFQNAGQSCIAAKRFIVVDSVAADFEAHLVNAAQRIVVGDPANDHTTMGPLARSDLRDTLQRQLDTSVAQGAIVATGGKALTRPGYFFAPTVLLSCTEDMPVWREETFGPLAAVMRVPDQESALRVANNSTFGLGGNIWTEDIGRGIALARLMESGGVFINGMTHSDPRLPFGGVKRSGYGRELSSFGIREFVNVQSIWADRR